MVLFLDFDGVLQTPALECWVEMEHCAGLERLLRELPALKIVVTSTHREGKSLASVRGMLPDGIARRVVDVTPVTPLGRARGGRQEEIELWLASHSLPKTWAAVDDEPYLYRETCSWLVPTHKWLGWSEETTAGLRDVLACQLSENYGDKSGAKQRQSRTTVTSILEMQVIASSR